jgi:O-antigen/teichoic acid export membrane protein
VGASLAVKLIAVVSSLCFIGATTRAFSKEEVAVLAVAAILTSIMDVSKGLGLGPLMMKRLPGLGGEVGPEGGSLVASFLVYSLLPPSLLAAMGWAAAPAMSHYWFDSSRYTTELRLGVLGGLAIVLTNTNLALLLTARQFRSWASLSMAASLLQRLVPCGLLFGLGLTLGEFLMGAMALTVAGLLAGIVPVSRLLRGSGARCLMPGAFWEESRHYYGSSVLRYLAAQADQLLVAALCEPASLAVYYVLRRLYSIAVMTMDSVFDALVPDLSKRAAEDTEGARAQLADWVRLTLYGGTIGGAVLAANGPGVVDAVVGSGYSDSRLLLIVFAAAAVTFFLLGLTQVDILLFGSSQDNFAVAASSAGVGGVSGAVLGTALGPVGLAAGLMAGHWAGLLVARRATGGCLPVRKLLVGLAVILLAGLVPGTPPAALPGWAAILLGNMLIVVFGWIHYSRWQVEECLRRIH